MYAVLNPCSPRGLVMLGALLLLNSCAAEDVSATTSPSGTEDAGVVITDAAPEAVLASSTTAQVADALASKSEDAAEAAEAAGEVAEAAEVPEAVGEALAEAPATGEGAATGDATAADATGTATDEAETTAETGAVTTEADATVLEAAAVAAAAAVPIDGDVGAPGQLGASQVKKAIDSYVVKRTVEGGGLFQVVDDETGEGLKLEFIGIRDPVRFIADSGYFASVEFRPTDDTVGKRYDLHFWVNVQAEKLVVTEMKVHKHPVKTATGWVQQARYTMVGHDAVPD